VQRTPDSPAPGRRDVDDSADALLHLLGVQKSVALTLCPRLLERDHELGYLGLRALQQGKAGPDYFGYVPVAAGRDRLGRKPFQLRGRVTLSMRLIIGVRGETGKVLHWRDREPYSAPHTWRTISWPDILHWASEPVAPAHKPDSCETPGYVAILPIVIAELAVVGGMPPGR
jgi:hypothetical protein